LEKMSRGDAVMMGYLYGAFYELPVRLLGRYVWSKIVHYHPLLYGLYSREFSFFSASEWTLNPDANHAHQPQSDSFVGRRLKDVSVFVLQGG
jgi:hypothetical protein